MKKELSPTHEMVACDVCGRTILKGERTEPYLVPDGTRRLVCDLCTRRAESAGWLRESRHGSMPASMPRAEPKRSLLSRLRRRFVENGPGGGAAPADPDLAYEHGEWDREEPGYGTGEEHGHEASGYRHGEPEHGYEEPGYGHGEPQHGHGEPEHPHEDAGYLREEPVHEHQGPAPAGGEAVYGHGEGKGQAQARNPYVEAPELSLEAELSEEPPAAGGREAAVAPEPRDEDLVAERSPIVPESPEAGSLLDEQFSREEEPEAYDPRHPEEDLLAEEPPSIEARLERRGRRYRRRVRDPRHVRAVPTNAEARVERALELFNLSEHRRTVGGLVRTLGEPWVTALPHADSTSEVTIVVAWELSWYQYRVDLSDAEDAVGLSDKGHEIHEIDAELRRWNATATDDGALVQGAPEA